MSTIVKDLIPVVRDRLIEPQPNFWGDDELIKIMAAGIRDLWRDVVDLKQEHYLTVDNTNVTLPSASSTLSGVPTDVHKIYLLEPRDLSTSSVNYGLSFTPLEYNDTTFMRARACDPVDPCNAQIYYAIQGQGAPVNAPTIRVAPQVNSTVNISFCYVPTLGTITAETIIPIPGEADNALIAWTAAFACGKEASGGRGPDQGWLQVYSTEKQHLLQSLGLREYQEPTYVTANFQEYW